MFSQPLLPVVFSTWMQLLSCGRTRCSRNDELKGLTLRYLSDIPCCRSVSEMTTLLFRCGSPEQRSVLCSIKTWGGCQKGKGDLQEMNRWDTGKISLLRFGCILNGQDAGSCTCMSYRGEAGRTDPVGWEVHVASSWPPAWFPGVVDPGSVVGVSERRQWRVAELKGCSQEVSTGRYVVTPGKHSPIFLAERFLGDSCPLPHTSTRARTHHTHAHTVCNGCEIWPFPASSADQGGPEILFCHMLFPRQAQYQGPNTWVIM